MIKKIFIISLLIISIGSISYGASFSIQSLKDSVDYLKSEGYLPNFPTNKITWGDTTIRNTNYKSYGIITTNSNVILALSWNNTINSQNDCQIWNLYGDNFRDHQNWANVSFENVQMAYSPYGIPIFGIPANEIYDKNKPVFNFEPNYFQKVFYTGINDEFNALKYDYSISSWKLGTFEDIPDDVDKIIVELHLNDGGIALTDSFLTFTKGFNNGYYFINNDNLYVYSRYIKYNTKYNLLFYLYDANNNFIESFQYNYVFLPTNATIENGVIVNVGSGDYNIQDSTNDTISSLTNSSDVDSIMDEYLSGDVEYVAGELGFTAFDNPFTSFLFFVIDGVYDVLTDTSNVVLTANYKTMHFVLHSDDFFTQDTTLKIFVRDMLICVYIYGNYKYFHYLITLLETARIDKFASEIGTDEFYDTDIM